MMLPYVETYLICLIILAAAQAAPAAPVPAIDEDSYAVLLAAVSEEGRLSGEEFRVVSIREL